MIYPFFFDWTVILIIPPLLLAFWAQRLVSSRYKKYSAVMSQSGLTGADVAREILRQKGIAVEVESTQGNLTDHYDPKAKKLRLSAQVYNGKSIAAYGIAAHEAGHAVQDFEGYTPIKIRHFLFPVSAFGSSAALPLFFIGFIFQFPFLIDLGIIFFLFAVMFSVITLPVEFNASAKAVTVLRNYSFLNRNEIDGVKKVLTAAALTYAAATLMAVMQLVRLLILRDRR